MYQEVAFDPQCLAEFHYYGLLKSEFGFEKGRYISAPVKAWVREAYKAVKASTQIQPAKKKSITNYLNKIQRAKTDCPITLPKYRDAVEFDIWENWCTEEIKLAPFNSIISEHFEQGLTHDDVIDDPDCWNITPTLQIRKKSKEIVGVIEPLIKLGGSLTIIDQYFRLSENEVLKGVIESANRLQSLSSITLVTTIQTANAEQVFKEQYLKLYPNCPNFNVVVAPEKYFHDRYVISGLGAIKAGHGFSEAPELGAQSDFVSISLCGNKEAKHTMAKLLEIVSNGKATQCKLINS